MNAIDYKRVRDGSALLTVAVVLGVLVIVVGAMMTYALNTPYVTRRIANQIRAKNIAEAGANEAYSILATNWSLRHNPSAFPAKDFRGGRFDADVQPIGTALAIITSTGIYREATAVAVLDIRNHNASTNETSTNNPPNAFSYAIVCGGQMTWSGSGLTDVSGGWIHSNYKYKMTGSQVISGNVSCVNEIWSVGSTEIRGTARAPNWKGSSPGNVTGGGTTAPVPLVPIPNIVLDPYLQWAQANGQVYNGNVHISGASDYVVPGGVMWVNGNFKWSGSGRFIGCVIATKDINFTGSGPQVKVGRLPAFISRDGNIDISGSGNINGLIYAKTGSFDKSGNGVIRGSVIAANEFRKTGGADVFIYEDSTPTPPGGGGETPLGGDLVGVAGWQQ